jgi:negative modulator of initiation of replication
MKTIEIEDDIHSHLVANLADFGESPSSVLRRLLRLNDAILQIEPMVADERGLKKLIHSPEFIYAKGVVGRFLEVLRWLHDAAPEEYTKVLNIKGRGRLYFAKDACTLEEAGRSVNPKQIPGTGYWVITTTPTALKQEILRLVMKELRYGIADINAATEAIVR